MKTITVKLPPELDDKLEALARKINKTKSVVVRLALEEILRRPGGPSAHDLLENFCGRIGTTKDLSTNQKYMSDYGK